MSGSFSKVDQNLNHSFSIGGAKFVTLLNWWRSSWKRFKATSLNSSFGSSTGRLCNSSIKPSDSEISLLLYYSQGLIQIMSFSKYLIKSKSCFENLSLSCLFSIFCSSGISIKSKVLQSSGKSIIYFCWNSSANEILMGIWVSLKNQY